MSNENNGSSEEQYVIKRAPLTEHLNELRYRVKISIISIGVITLALMIIPADVNFLQNPLMFYRPLIALILEYIRVYALPKEVELIGIRFMAPIELYLFSSLILGVILSMPIIAYEAYKFIDPALYPHEKKLIYPFMLAFSILFTVGALFGLFLIIPFLLKASLPFYGIVGAKPIVYVSDFYSLVLYTTLLTGLAFTIPVVFVLLVRLGFIDTSIVTGRRGIFYLILFIITAVITPDGGPIADFVLFLPMVILMESAIIIAKKYEKERTQPRRSIFDRVKKRTPIICPYCKAEIPDDSVFCPKCGRAVK